MISNLNDKAAIKKIDSPEYAVLRVKSNQSSNLDADYFYNLAINYSYQSKFGRQGHISIMGLNIPEEMIYAVGAVPVWTLGGSPEMAALSDKYVSRDTDAVSKSSLGLILSAMSSASRNADLTIIPITCDSMRKVASLLSKEIEVFPLDIPPLKADASSKAKWISQMYSLKTVLEKKTNRIMSPDSLIKAGEMVNMAKKQMAKLLYFSAANPNQISGDLAMLIINTYYMTDNIIEWTRKLTELNDSFNVKGTANKGYKSFNYMDPDSRSKPGIFIMGSPIYFPNFKIPLLLADLNIDILANIGEMTRRVYTLFDYDKKDKRNLDKLFEQTVYEYYLNDCSFSFIDHTSTMQYIKVLEKNFPVNGVIYHVLKGQVQPDFDISTYEAFFSSKNIPFLRLETDYNYHDIEQLRIRTEAFIEMIAADFYRMRA